MLASKCNLGWVTGILFATIYLPLHGMALAKEETLTDFYKGTPFSSIAIPLKIIRAASVQAISTSEKVRVLEPGLDHTNILPRQSKYCLLINHILDEDSQQHSERAYFALKLVFIDEYKPKEVDSIVIYRNAGSWRPRGTKAIPLNGQATPASTLSDFIGSLDLKSVNLADQQLGYQWHAAPRCSRYNSWDKRSYWKPTAGDNHYNSEAFYQRMKIKVNPFGFLTNHNKAARTSLLAALLSYSPAPPKSIPATVISSPEKVVFCFQRHDSIAAYLQLFSPIGGMPSDYLLIFDPQNKLLSL